MFRLHGSIRVLILTSYLDNKAVVVCFPVIFLPTQTKQRTTISRLSRKADFGYTEQHA
jgi:hypothetical protein